MWLESLAPAIAIGLPWLWAAIGLSLIGKAWVDSIGRNPESVSKSFTPGILALALTEAIAIYGFVIAFMLMPS